MLRRYRGDPRMLDVVRETGVGICVMHMQGTPQTMQDNPTYTDVVAEVFEFLRAARDRLESAGVNSRAYLRRSGYWIWKNPRAQSGTVGQLLAAA